MVKRWHWKRLVGMAVLAAIGWAICSKPPGWTQSAASDQSAKNSNPPERVLEGHRDNVYALAVAPDSTRLASASEDGTARIWDWSTGRCLAVLSHDGPTYDVAFSPDGKILATADGAGHVHLYNAQSFQKIRTLTGHTGPVYAVAFSPDGQWLATGGGEKDWSCRIWEAATGKLVATLAGHKGAVYGVAFSPRGTLATSSEDRSVRLWDWRGGTSRVLQGHNSYVYRCRFSPDGKLLATASHDRTVCVWDVETGRLQRTIGPFRHVVYAVALDKTGLRLACVGEGKLVCINKLEPDKDNAAEHGPCAEPIRGPRFAVFAVFWLAEQKGGTLFFGGSDRKIFVVPR